MNEKGYIEQKVKGLTPVPPNETEKALTCMLMVQPEAESTEETESYFITARCAKTFKRVGSLRLSDIVARANIKVCFDSEYKEVQ